MASRHPFASAAGTSYRRAVLNTRDDYEFAVLAKRREARKALGNPETMQAWFDSESLLKTNPTEGDSGIRVTVEDLLRRLIAQAAQYSTVDNNFTAAAAAYRHISERVGVCDTVLRGVLGQSPKFKELQELLRTLRTVPLRGEERTQYLNLSQAVWDECHQTFWKMYEKTAC